LTIFNTLLSSKLSQRVFRVR